jgi:hypothetical protein
MAPRFYAGRRNRHDVLIWHSMFTTKVKRTPEHSRYKADMEMREHYRIEQNE